MKSSRTKVVKVNLLARSKTSLLDCALYHSLLAVGHISVTLITGPKSFAGQAQAIFSLMGFPSHTVFALPPSSALLVAGDGHCHLAGPNMGLLLPNLERPMVSSTRAV